MKTRTTDYATVGSEQFKQFLVEPLTLEYKKLSKMVYHPFDIERIVIVNRCVNQIKKYFDLIYKVTNAQEISSWEGFLQTCLKKHKSFRETVLVWSFMDAFRNHDKFRILSRSLLSSSKELDKKIHDYFHRKYLFILSRTNRDIFRRVMSYLV